VLFHVRFHHYASVERAGWFSFINAPHRPMLNTLSARRDVGSTVHNTLSRNGLIGLHLFVVEADGDMNIAVDGGRCSVLQAVDGAVTGAHEFLETRITDEVIVHTLNRQKVALMLKIKLISL
jgi:hypothetical protein